MTDPGGERLFADSLLGQTWFVVSVFFVRQHYCSTSFSVVLYIYIWYIFLFCAPGGARPDWRALCAPAKSSGSKRIEDPLASLYSWFKFCVSSTVLLG